jgi:hypothetical protein
MAGTSITKERAPKRAPTKATATTSDHSRLAERRRRLRGSGEQGWLYLGLLSSLVSFVAGSRALLSLAGLVAPSFAASGACPQSHPQMMRIDQTIHCFPNYLSKLNFFAEQDPELKCCDPDWMCWSASSQGLDAGECGSSSSASDTPPPPPPPCEPFPLASCECSSGPGFCRWTCDDNSWVCQKGGGCTAQCN